MLLADRIHGVQEPGRRPSFLVGLADAREITPPSSSAPPAKAAEPVHHTPHCNVCPRGKFVVRYAKQAKITVSVERFSKEGQSLPDSGGRCLLKPVLLPRAEGFVMFDVSLHDTAEDHRNG